MKTYTQTFTTDLHEAAIAKYAGYDTHWLPNEQQWAIRNPGDLDDLFADVRAGRQTVADALSFLKTYDEMRQIKFGPSNETKPSTPKIDEPAPMVAIPGKEYYTRDAIAAAALVALGYTISRVDPPEGQWRWPRFHFADDGRAMSRSKDVSQQIKVWMDKQ
jgi:hypothetical protein